MLALSSAAKILIRRSPVAAAEFHSSAAALGRPFRRRDGRPVLHASQRPAEVADIDFSTLGLTYEIKKIPELVVQYHAWAPKPANPPNLPFMIDRTDTGMALPVYTDFVGGYTKVNTILRKIRGDVHILKEEVEKVVGKPVEVRPGKIVIEGNYNRRLKLWLLGLGF
eukprot:gene3583-4237_t